MRQLIYLLFLVTALFNPIFANAKIIDAKPNGFLIEHEFEFEKAPKEVFNTIIAPQKWWLSDHTWSGKASNLYLEPFASGCFCEKLKPGSVMHMQVIYFKPNQELRLSGALGPLQTMGVNGHLIFSLSEKDNVTVLKTRFTLGGYWENGLETLAPIVDSVLTQQFASLSKIIKSDGKK